MMMTMFLIERSEYDDDDVRELKYDDVTDQDMMMLLIERTKY